MSIDPKHNQSLKELDKERLFHPASSIADILENGPVVYKGAKGVRLKDIDGKEYIDGGAGLWCVNVGYGQEEIAETAKEAITNLNYYHLFGGSSNEPIIRLADKVLTLFHEETGAKNLSKVFFGTSGSDANDTNYKLVRYYNNLRGKPEKKKFISREGAYHGLTFAAAGLTGIEGYHKAFDVPIEGILHTSCPHYYRFHKDGESEEAFTDRLVDELQTMIDREGADTVAAFIAEPVMGTGGVFMPPKGYFEKVQKVLKENDILFIADEVITGFGRLGSWYGTGHYSLQPDIVTLAKGITSAYFPVSASVISEEIWEVLKNASPEMGPVMHGFTYSGHPVGAAIGLKNIEIIERENLIANAAEVGPYLLEKLTAAIGDHPHVGDVRGEGLMVAVEFIADKEERRWFDMKDGAHKLVAPKVMAEGLISRPLPYVEVMALSPPLLLTKSDADEAVAAFVRGLDKATPDLEALARK